MRPVGRGRPDDVRAALRVLGALLVFGVLGGCGTGAERDAASDADAPAATEARPEPLAGDDVPRQERIVRLLGALAADSMEGREAGTAGERRARDLLARELEAYGVEPAGEDGYLQAVPLVGTVDDQGRTRWRLPPEGTDLDTVPAERRRTAWNVLGVIPGTDPALSGEVVIVGAHYDHVGFGPSNEAGDSLYNGADDDATGTVASLEIARALAGAPAGEGPGRTVLVALFSAEEMGLLGPRWFLEHPTVPREALVADLQIEMIGRPDSLAGGFGRGWLTGYERSTMGDLLAEQGSPIVADPRPEMRFFFRSDNLPFAMDGIPAHTLSSYNLHEDYHSPDDEADRVDPAHMDALVGAALEMVRGLASGPTPSWNEGGRPEAS